MPGNRLTQTVLEWEVEGTGRKGRNKERWMDTVRRGVNNHGLAEEGTGNSDKVEKKRRFWVEENYCRVDKLKKEM